MTKDMIEMVAKAICKSRTCEGHNCCQWPAQGGRTKCPVRNGAYDYAAIDAIKAMDAWRFKAAGITSAVGKASSPGASSQPAESPGTRTGGGE